MGLYGRLVPPFLPVGQPGSKPILLVVNALVDLPVKCKEPVELHGVQLTDGDVADLSPGFVLECVVVQELASQEQSHREHAIDLATTSSIHLGRRKHAHPARKVIQSQKDSGTRQTGRRENLKDVFPELGRDRRSWVDDSLGHLSHEVGHLIHLIVQVSGDASGCFLLLAGLFWLRGNFLSAVL
jgi:hypothetical protein